MPERIQRKRTKGFRLPKDAVYVGRGTKWGNPWRVVQRGPAWFVEEPDGRIVPASQSATHQGAATTAVAWFTEATANGWEGAPSRDEIRNELAGKDLACWCKETDPCHADVLISLANGDTND